MNYQDYSHLKWQDFLVQTFTWLQNLELTTAPNATDSDVYTVLVQQAEKPDEEQISFDCPTLSAEQTTALQTALAQQKLKKVTQPMTVFAAGQLYILVPKSKYKLSPMEMGLQAGLDLANEISSRAYTSVAVLPGEDVCSTKIFEGLAAGLYQNTLYKGKSNEKDLDNQKSELPSKLTCVGTHITSQMLLESRTMAQAKAISRSLGDAPANKLNPSSWAQMAQQMATETGISCTIKAKKELEALGMGTFLSVAQGSNHEPHLICFEIEGQDPSKTAVLIGKGLTFDAGGVSLKPSGGMEDMKYDMCGGAGVFGSAYYLSQVKPPVNVVCLIGTVENLVGPDATKPNDVFRSMSGQTVEVKNTDAEGRLVLCDLLYYARTNWNVDFMIDTATLTGAVLIALGKYGSGVMSTDRAFGDFVVECSNMAGERSWQLPLWPEVMDTLKSSHVADLSNIPDPGVRCGTITAGAFLAHFVGDTPWAHIDIAATGFHGAISGHPKKGASGVVLGTLIKCIEQKYRS
ncbi:MAG: M17 family metallopeptidase [Zetaproteobacteria bacterium]|nr:M17 family metallopeptidase [Zetaproteobacteria bacterium]